MLERRAAQYIYLQEIKLKNFVNLLSYAVSRV